MTFREIKHGKEWLLFVGAVKSGSESCGVQRQWCGRLGKKENCQVGVFLMGVTPAGTALLDHQLYLPKEWAPHRPPIWLVIRRSLSENPVVKYYVSNADEHTPLESMALVTGTRWRVEEFFEDGKGDFGMADYEARAWTSWHHHMTLVALAHLFISLTRHHLQDEMPELTLPLTLELMKATMSRPTLTEEDPIRLTEYHLHRNRVASESHRKSWKRKHKRIKPKSLLWNYTLFGKSHSIFSLANPLLSSRRRGC